MKNALWAGISLCLCLFCGSASAETPIRSELAEVAGQALGSVDVPTPSAAAVPAASQNSGAREECLSLTDSFHLVRDVMVRLGGSKLSDVAMSAHVADILPAKSFYKAVAQEVKKRGCAIDRVAQLARLDDMAWYLSDESYKAAEANPVLLRR